MKLSEFLQTKIPVVEIFNSISGEGISAGSIVTFVRTAGCNLRCSYCDTKYSYDEVGSDIIMLRPEEILKKVEEYGCKELVCTGGEPLEENKAKRYLPLYLAVNGYDIRIETNGSCPVYNAGELSEYAGDKSIKLNYVLDVKCPGSDMSDHNIYEENYSRLNEGDELKFVVGSKEDLEYAYEIIDKYSNYFVESKVVINFSPVFNRIKPAALVEALKERHQHFANKGIKVRLSLQLHKYIWTPDMKGV